MSVSVNALGFIKGWQGAIGSVPAFEGVPGELWGVEPGSSACKAYSLTFESPFSPVLFCPMGTFVFSEPFGA